jgi:hypothetical protein
MTAQMCHCGVRPADSDGLCGVCRCRKLGQASRRYHFSSELLEALRHAYQERRSELSGSLSTLEAKTGWPRHAFTKEAIRRGWTQESRPWTEQEIDSIREHIGRISIRAIAARLRRSRASTERMAKRLQLSRRPSEGYNAGDLCQVFGVSDRRVAGWIQRGLFGRVHRHGREVRVSESAVVRFLRTHHAEYKLLHVDEVWFKAMVLGSEEDYE